MKEIIIAVLSAMGGALISATITVDYYSRKYLKKNVFQRVSQKVVGFVNINTSNVYNDAEKISSIVDDKMKDIQNTALSDEQPQNQKINDEWLQEYDK